MNRILTPVFFGLFTLVGTTTGSAAEASPALQMRDAASHDVLSQKLRMAQQKDPIRNLGPAAGKVDVDPSKNLSGRDLIKDSTILCYRGNLTLVPKQAVLHLPENLKDRSKEQSGVKIIAWSEFYQSNRGWIRTVEVTREQATGLAPLPETIVEAYQKSTSVVIATFKGGPISVLPYKEPEEIAQTGETPTNLKTAARKP